MVGKEKKRSIIITPEEFYYLRILHQDGEDVSIEHVRDRMAISRSSADKYRNCLSEKGVLSQKGNKINVNHSCYLGISVKDESINITFISLDGNILLWDNADLTIKLDDNSIESIVNACGKIKSIIDVANKSKKVLGVCFSFDDVDKEKELFYVSDERFHVQKHYKFSDFVKLLFGEYKDVHFSLSSNAMSMLAAQEYPFRKSKNDRVCIMQTQNGVYAAEISNNKIKYGFNKQTHNISALLDDVQLEKLLANELTGQERIRIYEIIVNNYMIISNPERISILIPEEVEEKDCDKFIFYMNDKYNRNGIRNYSPDIIFAHESIISYGAAISAMYYAFGWDESMI